MAAAGDVNGDGFGDLLIGSPTARSGFGGFGLVRPTGPGAAFAYYGTLPASLASLLGLTTVEVLDSGECVLGADPCILDSYAWSGDESSTLLANTENDLAAGVGLSPRQLERLFRQHLDSTPKRYYLELRLRRARQLLLNSALPVLDVAFACGFVSGSHFSKCYREHFATMPHEERSVAA